MPVFSALLLSSLLRPENPASFADLIVTPSIQLGNRTVNGENSVAVLWQTTDQEHPYTLKFNQGGKDQSAQVGYHTIKVDNIAPHRVYIAVLKDYKPGQKVSYRLESGTEVLYKDTFMAPKGAKQDYTFAVFGDCGSGEPPQAEIAYQTYRLKPDLLLLTGDLVYNRGLITEYRKNFYPYYTPEVASPKNGANILGNTLVAAAPGNHDILHRALDTSPDALAYFYYWSQPLNGPLGDVGNPSTPTLSGADARKDAFLKNAGPNYPRMANFSFDYGNAHITSLDANPYVDWSDPKIRAWLKADLAKGANKTWRFVMFHHPGFHSSPSHQGEKQMRQVADLFEEGKVDVVFAGHVHNYQRTFPIQVGEKKGKDKAELAKDDWPVDKSYDGLKNTKPKGVIYLVDGAGGNDLYNPELNGKPELWKPFQANYLAEFSLSIVEIKGKTFTLRQIDRQGKQIDQIKITK
ncbi:MAG: hypothetical protein BGO01_17210 [Armatimonadetes bacterium 55-13]|nr:metallophosphoesterase [Armatimonadota bacterium]OJU63893.1 MAG: hypothetical protein BGO01_17210 [Armatimonadetes bacterium 55-13]